MKDALFLTGAAARISQEVAIIDELIRKRELQLDEHNLMLAGFSSGALNIAAINACFRSNTPLSWDNYFKKEILFSLKNEDVYLSNKKIPLDTSPLRKTIEKFLTSAKIETLENFTFQSFILTFSYFHLSTLWATNTREKHKKLNCADMLMATSAIPIIFPDQSITTNEIKKRRFSRGRFADGGTGGSFKRFELYLRKYYWQYGPLNKVYIVSPMREITHEDYENLYSIIPQFDFFKMELEDIKLLRVFLEMISLNGFDSFIKRLYKWNKKYGVAKEIYVCIPQLDENFPLLNFEKQQEQYDAVSCWLNNNPHKLATPIEEYHATINTTNILKNEKQKGFFTKTDCWNFFRWVFSYLKENKSKQ